jgi:hypothetical protein
VSSIFSKIFSDISNFTARLFDFRFLVLVKSSWCKFRLHWVTERLLSRYNFCTSSFYSSVTMADKIYWISCSLRAHFTVIWLLNFITLKVNN